MADEVVSESVKREIWRRDDFTCQYCGRIVVWEDLKLVPIDGPEAEGKEGPDALVSVCAKCLEEGKKAPLPDEGDRRLLKLKRDMEELSASEDSMVLDRDRRSGKQAMERKVSELQAENRRLIDELNDKTALAIAYKKKLDMALQDLDNNRRRTENEIALKVRDRTKGLALSILASIDNLDLAVKDASRRGTDPKSFEGLLAGLRGIRKGLLSELEGNGIKVIEPNGAPFDPNYHEALGSMEDRTIPSDTVLMVMSPGCLLDGKVLRPARVMVSRGGPKRPKEKTLHGAPGPGDQRELGPAECLEGEEWDHEEDAFEVDNGGVPLRIGPSSPEEGPRTVGTGKVSLRRCRKRKV